MTAVEFIVEQLAKNGVLHSSDIAKAKEIEEKRMLEFAGIVSVAAVARGTGWSIRDLYNEYK
jgi:hypothetical protein